MPVKLDLGFMTFDLRELSAYARRAEELGVGALWSAETKGDWQGMAELINDETLDDFAVTATWKALGARLRERYDGICGRTQFYPAFQPSLDDPRLQALVKEMNQG